MSRKDVILSTAGIPIDLGAFLKDSAELQEVNFQPTGAVIDLDDVIEIAATATGISLDEAELYEEEVSLPALSGSILPPANDSFYDDRKDKSFPRDLHAYQFFKEVQLAKLHPIKKQQTVNYLRSIDRDSYDLGEGYSESAVVSTPEIVIQISVYKENKMVKTRSVLVLGSQRISDFVDAIECPQDLDICWHDNSNNPDLVNVDWSKKNRKSSLLYMGDTLFVDRRNPGHTDYSEEIIKFMTVNSEGMARGQKAIEKVEDMTSKTFRELTINMGLPYVFIHCGSCEHLVVVERVRMFHPEDDPRKANYPKQVFRGGPRRMACSICNDKLARWITYSDEEAPSSPCFFCFDCFYCLHYTESLEKQHEFFAYVYLENCEDRIGYQVALEKHKQNRKMLIDK